MVNLRGHEVYSMDLRGHTDTKSRFQKTYEWMKQHLRECPDLRLEDLKDQ